MQDQRKSRQQIPLITCEDVNTSLWSEIGENVVAVADDDADIDLENSPGRRNVKVEEMFNLSLFKD